MRGAMGLRYTAIETGGSVFRTMLTNVSEIHIKGDSV